MYPWTYICVCVTSQENAPLGEMPRRSCQMVGNPEVGGLFLSTSLGNNGPRCQERLHRMPKQRMARHDAQTAKCLLLSRHRNRKARQAAGAQVMHPRELLRNSNHNFPHLRIRFEIFVGLNGLRKRKYPRDLRMEPSIRQPVVDILLRRWQLLRIARDLHQGVATNAESLTKRR